MQFLINFGAMMLTVLICLLIYALKRAKNFSVGLWILQNRLRFLLAFALVLCLSVAITFSPEIIEILNIVGLQVKGGSAAFIGTAIGVLLISTTRSAK